MNVNPNLDEQTFVPYIFFLIAVLPKSAYILSQSFRSVKVKVLYILNYKYAFKKMTFVCIDLDHSAVIFHMWFLRVYYLYSVHTDLANRFCIVQVIILVFVLRNQNNSIIVFYWSTILSHHSSYYSVIYINSQTILVYH